MSEEKDQKQELHIGQKLKEARQAKGMTLDDLQQATKIQKRYLIAIEDEKFDELPGDFYVRAFVKQYANTVGLNGANLLQDYDEQLPETKTASYSDHLDEAVETRRGRQHQATADRIDQLRHYLPTIIVVLVVVVILAGIWLTAIVRNHRNASTKIDSSSVKVSGESSHKAKKKAPKKTSKKTKQANVKLTESSRTANAVVYRSDAGLKSSTKLTISNSASGYNSVTVDGSQRLAKQMGANSKSTVVLSKNAKSITIRIGNPSQTKIKLGNKTINFTKGNRYPNTRTVTIMLDAKNSSSSSSSTTNTNQTTTNRTNTGNTATSRTTGNNTSTQTNTTTRPAQQQTSRAATSNNNNVTNNNQATTTNGNARP